MPLPARKDLVGDPPWLASLLAAAAEGTSTAAWSRQPGNPIHGTVCAWMRDRPDIRERVAHARASGADHVIDEAVTVARGPTRPDGSYDADADSATRVARDRLKVDTLRWLAGVWDPERLAPHARTGQGNINVTVITGVPDAVADQRSRLVLEAEQPETPQLQQGATDPGDPDLD